MNEFDHTSVFRLDGQHVDLECSACHANQVFRGTPRECAACHAEPEVHAGLFGTQCAACHTAEAWAPAQLTQHAFPLDHGGQGEVACATCHTASYVAYTCAGCHEHEPGLTERQHASVDIGDRRLEDCAACHPAGQRDEADQ
jgi:hypothetical protein